MDVTIKSHCNIRECPPRSSQSTMAGASVHTEHGINVYRRLHNARTNFALV